MTKKTINVTEINRETERVYAAQKVHAAVYSAAMQLDVEARAQLVRTAQALLSRAPLPGEDETTMRESGHRIMFACSALEIEEMQAVEESLPGRDRRQRSAVVRPAWLAIDKAQTSSYVSVHGHPQRLRYWTDSEKSFFKARADKGFQCFLLDVGIKAGKVTPALRKAAKAAIAQAKRQGIDPMDFDPLEHQPPRLQSRGMN
ncbi:MAG: hypothetical protein U1C47_02275 [Hydrogenophaga sp.]|nr:hypothetical protein [Hydrogenophaga sp.]